MKWCAAAYDSTHVPTGRPEAISGRYAHAVYSDTCSTSVGYRRSRSPRDSKNAGTPVRSTWLPGVGSDSGIPSYRSTTCGSPYPRWPRMRSRPARDPRITSPWLPTAGAISSATSCTTSCTPTASVSAPARLSTWEMVTSRVPARSGRGIVRFISATARARLIRTLSPVVLGYSRNDSQSFGGRSATNEVTCWLNSAAR